MKPRLVSVADRNGDILVAGEKPAPVFRDNLHHRGPMATRQYRPRLPEKPLADYTRVDWVDRMLLIAIMIVGCSALALAIGSVL